jgi:hypothetical protein
VVAIAPAGAGVTARIGLICVSISASLVLSLVYNTGCKEKSSTDDNVLAEQEELSAAQMRKQTGVSNIIDE